MTALDDLLFQAKAAVLNCRYGVHRRAAGAAAREFMDRNGAGDGADQALLLMMLALADATDAGVIAHLAAALDRLVDAIRAGRALAAQARIAARPARLHWQGGANG